MCAIAFAAGSASAADPKEGSFTTSDGVRLHYIEAGSGDVLVMGGPSRLRFHGVTRILPGTAPADTGPGRFNLTFRQW